MIRLTPRKTRKKKKSIHIPIAAPFRAELVALFKSAGKPKAGDVWPEEAALYQEQGAGAFSNDFYELVLVPCGLVPVRTKQGQGRAAARKINPISFHSFRHSFVSLLKATGGSQIVARELAGHSSDLISDSYTSLPPEVLTKAIKALPMLEVK